MISPFRIFEPLALGLKNRVYPEFTILKIYFLLFRIFEPLALDLKNILCPEFTALNIYFLSFRIFEQLALGLKNRVCPENFQAGGGLPPVAQLTGGRGA